MAREVKVILCSPLLGAEVAEALWADMQELYAMKRDTAGFRSAALWYGLQLVGGSWSLLKLSRLNLADKVTIPWKKWAVAIFAAPLTVTLGWVLATHRPDTPAPAISQAKKSVVMMIDTSASVSARSRAALNNLLKTVLDDRSALTLTVFAIDSRAALKPPIAEVSLPETALSLKSPLFKPGDRQREIEAVRQRRMRAEMLLHEIGHYLDVQSPANGAIYANLLQAVEYLRERPGDSRKVIIVFSDLMEDSEPAIARALQEPVGSTVDIARSIDNRDITVVLSAYAENHDAAWRRRNEVWTRLFSDPAQVKFEFSRAQ